MAVSIKNVFRRLKVKLDSEIIYGKLININLSVFMQFHCYGLTLA